MKRSDKGLAFMLQYENIAWYEEGVVRILDRRVYPNEISYVDCHSYLEVAQAITDMVTQSGGPYSAARMGMALAAYQCRNEKESYQVDFLQNAAKTISNARPTTRKRMELVTDECLKIAFDALKNGEDVSEKIFIHSIDALNEKYDKFDLVAKNLVNMFPKTGNIMTQCFGETIVGCMLREAKNRELDIKMYIPETRPYFQGARLTASVSQDQDFDTTVITDNMVAFTMEQKGIDVFTSAADAICLDGYVVNKIGTYQMAIVAKELGVPYFVTGFPDIAHPTIETVEIEYRDPDFVLQAMGVRTAMQGVKGMYPSFDITPPHLISGVVTDKGIFSAYDLDSYVHDNFIEP